eukprot:3936054-Rhodomonas_salina.1
MMMMRRQRQVLSKRKVLRAWDMLTKEDKGGLYLPIFTLRVQKRVVRDAWYPFSRPNAFAALRNQTRALGFLVLSVLRGRLVAFDFAVSGTGHRAAPRLL